MLRIAIFLAALAVAAPAASAQTAPPAAASAFVPTRFSVQTVGSGPDVVLIPGLTASREVWRATVAANPGFRYHLVQVAGFAGAPPRGNARGPVVAPLAEELARYIASRGLRRPAVIGHSMGGTIALRIAARHPELVGKVMVVDMLPEPAGLFGSTAAGLGGIADLLTSLTGGDGGRRLVESAMDFFAADPAEARRSDPDVVARAANELARTDLTPELPRIRAPLTIVYASLDPARNRQVDQRYRAAYSGVRGARLERIDHSGHMVMYDQPGPFSAAVRRFLAPLSAAAAAGTRQGG